MQHNISGSKQVNEEIQNQRISKQNSQVDFEQFNVATSTIKDGKKSILQTNFMIYIF